MGRPAWSGEFVEGHRFGALVVVPGIAFGGFGVRQAADFLHLSIGFRLDLVQVAYPVGADSGRIAVALGQKTLSFSPTASGISLL